MSDVDQEVYDSPSAQPYVYDTPSEEDFYSSPSAQPYVYDTPSEEDFYSSPSAQPSDDYSPSLQTPSADDFSGWFDVMVNDPGGKEIMDSLGITTVIDMFPALQPSPSSTTNILGDTEEKPKSAATQQEEAPIGRLPGTNRSIEQKLNDLQKSITGDKTTQSLIALGGSFLTSLLGAPARKAAADQSAQNNQFNQKLQTDALAYQKEKDAAAAADRKADREAAAAEREADRKAQMQLAMMKLQAEAANRPDNSARDALYGQQTQALKNQMTGIPQMRVKAPGLLQTAGRITPTIGTKLGLKV